ncbi:MAG: chromosomal replication initiator protein DnaA [Candidatus Cryptobacteroides sp.]
MVENEKHLQVWENCLRIIEQNILPEQFQTWFKPVRPVSLIDSTITIEVPSDYFRLYLDTAFIDIIKRTLRRVIGADARLKYRVAPVQGQPSMTVNAAAGGVSTNNAIAISAAAPSGNTGPLVFPTVKKIQIDPRLNPAYRFATLVEGECNKLGISAGMDISDKPGKTPFNPLFIFGGPGLGKTHLAQAIGNAIKDKYQDCTVLYVTGSEFKNQYIEATVVRNKLNEFLAFYMKIDVLIVDDIQDLHGQGNQSAFFSIFNHLHQHSKQLILTSDRPPKDLEDFEERLLSRFKWGLSVELGHPDYETRLAMLRARSQREGLLVDDEVLRYLAANIKSNFRELEGALVSMMAHATLTHRDCTVELASQVVETLICEQKNELTIDMVQKAVCDYFKISHDDLVSGSRKRQIVQARQISMYLCRTLIDNCPLALIGRETGGKDHSTVLHSCNTVNDLMSTDRNFKRYVDELQGILCPIFD